MAIDKGDGTLLGALFESLMTLSVRVYAQACEARVHHLRTQGGELQVEIGSIVTRVAPTLLAMPGRGVLSAAKIMAEVAGIDRFRSRAAFARRNESNAFQLILAVKNS